MKKYFLESLLTMIMVVFVGMSFTSCGDEDDELEKTENLSAQDPAGTVVVNLQNDDNAIYIHTGEYTYTYVGGGVMDGQTGTTSSSFDLGMNSSNNFYVNGTEIISIGLVNGLGSVNKIPETGWSSQVAVVPGTGYIVRCRVATKYEYEGVRYSGPYYNPRYDSYCYSRIYVVDYMTNTGGGIMGATIKYQGDWKTPDSN